MIMKKKLKSDSPLRAATCSRSSLTPETDAFEANQHPSCRFPSVLEQMRKLERERNEWKANHDNQVQIKRIIAARLDMKDRAPMVEKLMAERNRAQGWSTLQRERIKRLESTLAKWIEWARMHGHIEHAAGIADDSRRLISSENDQVEQPPGSGTPTTQKPI